MHVVSSALLLFVFIVDVFSDSEPAPVLNCDPPDPSGLANRYKVALNRNGIINSAERFCTQYQGRSVPDKGIEETFGPYGPASRPEDHTQSITLSVKPVHGCSEWEDLVDLGSCRTAFKMLADSCDTHTRLAKRGGSVDYKCVTWEISGSGGADLYQLHLSQKMVDDWSAIEWTMYDSRGLIVGGPSSDPHPTGAPYKLEFWVDSATERDATNVRIRYPWANDVPKANQVQTAHVGGQGVQYTLPQQVEWSTGWTGKGQGSESYIASYFCDDVLDPGLPPDSPRRWQSFTRPEQQGRWGFRREFDCWFRGWAGKDAARLYQLRVQDIYAVTGIVS